MGNSQDETLGLDFLDQERSAPYRLLQSQLPLPSVQHLHLKGILLIGTVKESPTNQGTAHGPHKMAETSAPALPSIVSSQKFPSLIERYYTQKFAIDVGGPGEDLYVYCHTNGLLVIGLAPSHPIVQQSKAVKNVSFQSQHRDFTKNVVRGAKKKGGARMRPDGSLALITCEDGTEYSIKSCVNASLLEVNAQLQSKPGLLTQMPATQGYLALFQPLFNDKNPAGDLMSLEDYQKLRYPTEVPEESARMDVAE